jgi:hypothetical protein
MDVTTIHANPYVNGANRTRPHMVGVLDWGHGFI